MELFNKLLLLFFITFSLNATVIPERDANGKIITKSDAFASKSNYNFRGTGTACTINASSSKDCEYILTYGHVKFNGLEIINGAIGDKADLVILDTSTGTYSSVANAILNQFGFAWNMKNDVKETLPYTSDLYTGMRIVVRYTNNSGSARTIYINYYLHEE